MDVPAAVDKAFSMAVLANSFLLALRAANHSCALAPFMLNDTKATPKRWDDHVLQATWRRSSCKHAVPFPSKVTSLILSDNETLHMS
jgi:hypothetical protein